MYHNTTRSLDEPILTAARLKIAICEHLSLIHRSRVGLLGRKVPRNLLPQSLRRAKTLSPFGLAALTLSGKGKRFTDLS